MDVSLKQLYFQALDVLAIEPKDGFALNVKDYIHNVVMGGDTRDWEEEYDYLQRAKLMDLDRLEPVS